MLSGSDAETVLRLVLAAVLGAAVGLERELHKKPAGFRTHALVCLGVALFTTVSDKGFPFPADPSRVAAGVVTGIGFIGAGAIIRERQRGNMVVGVTTAASIWTVAAIGMAMALGMYLVSVVGTVLAVVLLLVHPGSKG